MRRKQRGYGLFRKKKKYIRVDVPWALQAVNILNQSLQNQRGSGLRRRRRQRGGLFFALPALLKNL